MLTLEIILFCNQKVNEKMYTWDFIIVNIIAFSFIFSLTLQFKGLIRKHQAVVVKDISKLWFIDTELTKKLGYLYFKIKFSQSRNLTILQSE